MEKDIEWEFNHRYELLEDTDKRQRLFTDACHNLTTNDVTDIQEALSDIIYNDINDELL